ncbi:hypothetical protein EYR36_004919 [Pleurotus pulmonarius]|nr:hypothetical protein EYR36_004919 [Pleurotus pulmonarius]
MNNFIFAPFDICDPRALPVPDGGLPFSSLQGFPPLEGIGSDGLPPLNPNETALPDVFSSLVPLCAIRTVHERLCMTHSDDNGCPQSNTSNIDSLEENFPFQSDLWMLNGYDTGFIAEPMSSNTVYHGVPQPWQVPPPEITPIPSPPYITGEYDIPDGDQRSYEGGKRVRERYKEHAQSSPYDQTQRQHAANSEWWYGGDTAYPPPDPPSPLRPAYRDDTTAHYLVAQNGASPKESAFRNRDSDAKVTFDFGLPSPADSTTSSISSSSGSSIESRKSRKHFTDGVRSRAMTKAKNRFKILFPSRTLAKSEELAVRVCSHMLSTGEVPRSEMELQPWSNRSAAAMSPSRSEGNEVEASAPPEVKLARRRVLKQRSDTLRNTTARALDDELRGLFGASGVLLDVMDIAYDFLVYAKERGVVPDMTPPAWRQECALMNVAAGPFFEKTK